MSKHKSTTFSDYDVRVRAYRIWEKSGHPEGRAEEHWREALAELEAERRAKEKAETEVPPQPELSSRPERLVADEIAKSQDEAA